MENLFTSRQTDYEWRAAPGRGHTVIHYCRYIGPSFETSIAYWKIGTLWYTGKRWVMWVFPLNLSMIETEYYDAKNPPKELVETMATMA